MQRCGGTVCASMDSALLSVTAKSASFIQQAHDAWLTNLFQFFKRAYTDACLAEKEYVNM
jgi:hypothetical protein